MQGLPVPVAPATALIAAAELAAGFVDADTSDRTRDAYGRDFADFTTWCSSVEVAALPASPGLVASYLATLTSRGLKASTIKRRIAAIRFAHLRAGHPNPTTDELVRRAHKGIRRTIGTRVEQKAPATAKAVGSMLKRIPVDTLAGRRDRALLLMGFAGAFRRSELVALDVEDVRWVDGGALVIVRRSKTDQEGAGQEVGIVEGSKLRPLAALRDWLEAAEITSGPIFRRIRCGDRLTSDRLNDRTVADVVKRCAAAAKLDPSVFAGHSLRAGFITSALESGADVFAAANHARHVKLETTREYDRRLRLLSNNAGRRFL